MKSLLVESQKDIKKDSELGIFANKTNITKLAVWGFLGPEEHS